jgi:hypothetical protein
MYEDDPQSQALSPTILLVGTIGIELQEFFLSSY